MLTYFAVSNTSIIPVYRIKEGWIPIQEYREDKNDLYYVCGNRDSYCIPVYDEDVYDNLNDAIAVCKHKIENNFIRDINKLIQDRQNDLERINKLEKT
jgi:hypothetical protein